MLDRRQQNESLAFRGVPHRWNLLMDALGFKPYEGAFESLMLAYGESSRHYHDLNHIMEGLDVLDRLGADPITKLAFWWHDARYNVASSENEAMSALWMLDSFMGEGGAHINGTSVLREANRLIVLTTDHEVESFDVRGCHMVVADLYRLAVGADEYAAHAYAIREEYGKYSDKEWFAGRRKFIEHMTQGRFYIFPPAREYQNLEAQAHNNLDAELRAIG